jgi:teichoic acid transport system permease protein
MAAGKNVMRSFSFPRATLPFAAALRETLNMMPVLATMVVLLVVVPPHAEITWRWLLFPGVFALHVLFNLGLVMLVARFAAAFPDVKNLVPFVSRFWLYGSGVMYAFDRFVSHPTLLKILELNPMHVVLDMSRDILLYATTPEISSWLILSLWAATAAAAGFLLFWQGEERYGNG